MDQIFELIFKNYDIGLTGLLAILIFYFYRKDSQEHRKEYKEVINQMIEALEKNTQANTKLAESLEHVKDEIFRRSV